MGLVNVDVNTNPIPASILVPKPFTYPSGGSGGSGGSVVIAPHNGVRYAQFSGIYGAGLLGNVKIGTLTINLLGNRQLSGMMAYSVQGFLAPGETVQCKINYTAKVGTTIIGGGVIQVPYIYVDDSNVPISFPIMLSTVGYTGLTDIDLYVNNESKKQAPMVFPNPPVITPCPLGTIPFYGYAMEFDSI